MTIADQLQTRIDAISVELVRLQGVVAIQETAQVTGDGPDRVQLPASSWTYHRMGVLEKERDSKQVELNRLNGFRRATSRRVIRC